MSEPLAQALRISGASLIMLTSMESRTTVWSAGRARVGADVAALGAAITEAAAEMVRLTAVGIEMDDLLVTSPANFHLLRVVDGQVAHLVLDRGSANLAMARREFRQVVADRSSPALPAQPPAEASYPADAPVPFEYEPRMFDEGPHEEASYDASVEPGSVEPGSAAEAWDEASDRMSDRASEEVSAGASGEAEVIDAEFVEGEVVEAEAEPQGLPFQAIPMQAPPRAEVAPPLAVASPFQAIPVQAASHVEAAVDFGRVDAQHVSEALEGEVLPASTNDLAQTDRDLPRLPQRRADASWQDDPTAYQATVPALPDWLRVAAEGPFVNDLTTLDRVVGGLRRLR